MFSDWTCIPAVFSGKRSTVAEVMAERMHWKGDFVNLYGSGSKISVIFYIMICLTMQATPDAAYH